jgi:hypothetical protein
MPGERDHKDQPDLDRLRPPAPGAPVQRTHRPAITGAGDPRLGVSSAGTHADLMHVQRTAGNAAVASLVAPVVQRVVGIDDVTASADSPAPSDAGASGATGPGAATPAGAGPEGDHTITASHIGLNAPMVEATGVVRAQTVIADSIVAASYTPGAGNQW